MKLTAKFHIGFIGISLVVSLSLIGIAYVSMVNSFEKHEGTRIMNNVIQTANSIDDFMFSRVKDFNILSKTPVFITGSHEMISEYLSNLVGLYLFYEDIFFVDKNGIVVSSSGQRLVGENILTHEPDIIEEFDATIKGNPQDVFISDIGKVSQEELEANSPLDIELLTGVVDVSGNTVGALVGFVNLQFISQIVSDLDARTSTTEYTYLVNDPGDILITADKTAAILKPHPDLAIENLQQKLEGDENGYMIYINSKGKKVISGYADLSEYGSEMVGDWSLLSIAPYEEIMRPAYLMLKKALFVFSIILSGIIALAVLFSRTLSRPIIELQKAVTNFKIESQPSKLEVRTKDEVGSLCEAFNNMTESLYNASQEIKTLRGIRNFFKSVG